MMHSILLPLYYVEPLVFKHHVIVKHTVEQEASTTASFCRYPTMDMFTAKEHIYCISVQSSNDFNFVACIYFADF